MNCQSCGVALPADSEFCHNCGAKVEAEAQPERGEEPQARPSAPPPPPSTARAAPVPPSAAVGPGPPPVGRSRYGGASLVAGTLWIIGWIVAVVGVIIAIAAAGGADCAEVLGKDSGFFAEGECSGGEEAGVRIGLFLGITLLAWLYAVIILWLSYTLRLVSDIEVNLRR